MFGKSKVAVLKMPKLLRPDKVPPQRPPAHRFTGQFSTP